MKPLTTVPDAAFGVMVSVMVPDWPGARVSGVYGAPAVTVCAHTSPVLEVTALSNGLAVATAVTFVVPDTALVHGQVALGATHSCPGATSAALSVATELSPDETPSSSGSLLSEFMSMTIGSVDLAVMTSLLVSVGTRKTVFTLDVSGSGTVTVASV